MCFALCEMKGWVTTNLQTFRKHLKRPAQWRHNISSQGWDTSSPNCSYCMLAELVWKTFLRCTCPPTLPFSIPLLPHVVPSSQGKTGCFLDCPLPFEFGKTAHPCCGRHSGCSPPSAHSANVLSTLKWRGCECRVKAEEKEIKRERNRQEGHYI